MNTHIPIEQFNAELRRLGRGIERDTEIRQEWRGDEFGLHLSWSDGFCTWIGFGPAGTAAIEARDAVKH